MEKFPNIKTKQNTIKVSKKPFNDGKERGETVPIQKGLTRKPRFVQHQLF